MKKIIAIAAAILMIISAVPTAVFASSTSVTQNPPVTMPKAPPVIDGKLEDDISDGYWSSPAKFDDTTAGYFWAQNKLTMSGDLYFAYNNEGLFFAADIVDNDEDSGFALSTGYDDVDPSGSKKPYGYNGDVCVLMLDILGEFERKSYNTPWYCVGMFENNVVRVYRSQAREQEITSQVQASGEITEDGWKFELFIPWSIIVQDAKIASNYNISKTVEQMYASGASHRASVMYMDRIPESATWGRYITVCTKTYDGYAGTVTNGTSPKSYGLKLVNGAQAHIHNWGEWETVTPVSCLADGSRKHSCISCGKTVTEILKAPGHGDFYDKISQPTCVNNGIKYTFCGFCNQKMSSEPIKAIGHDLGEWFTDKEPTASDNGIEKRVCSRCDYSETRLIPASNAPAITNDNYLVFIPDATDVLYIRVAPGIIANAGDVKTAPGLVSYNASYIASHTEDNKVTIDMRDGGVYTFSIKKTDGKWYNVSCDISSMEQEVVSDGVTVTVKNLYGVKDYFISKGSCTTYEEIKANQIVRVITDNIGVRHSYTNVLSEPGDYTVYIRYDDNSRQESFIYHTVTVTEPSFVYDGLEMHISNIDDVRSIRYAYGTYTSSQNIKQAETYRGFSAKTVAAKDTFTIRFPKEGVITCVVEYRTGYKKFVQYDVKKKVPGVLTRGVDVYLSELDGVYIVRYAKGEYQSGAEVKNASGSRFIRPAQVDNGKCKIENLEDGATYTIYVEYADSSKNIITVHPSNMPSEDKIAYVGSERQVLLEDYAIDYEYTTAQLNYIEPVKKGSVFNFSQGYEATDAVYHNIVKLPNNTYRMYYKATDSSGHRRICYITSTNGTTWSRPTIGKYSYNGSTANNIVTDSSIDNLFVFYDDNPNATGYRWKGIYGEWGNALYLVYSQNGNEFFKNGTATLLTTPQETGGCFFDTLNTVYYDSAKGKYVGFVRGFHRGSDYSLSKQFVQENETKITRDIRYTESEDGLHWTTPVPIKYDEGGDIQMYANAIAPYYRANQLYVGFPTQLSYYGKAQDKVTDVYLMSSRDLINWDRTAAPIMTPNGEGSHYYYGNSGYPCVGIIQTGAKEMSIYMKEKNNSSGCMVLYRYTLRIDGFRGASGGEESSELVTKYLNYTGSSLAVNYKTEAGGKIRVTATDVKGNRISSDWFSGDAIDQTVEFSSELSTLAEGPVQLSFELCNASIYSFKFN
ncbi:MAG: sialidase family protein [Clostridia bacterium]|nr:sialidase family protein [Clostridia bacterium]